MRVGAFTKLLLAIGTMTIGCSSGSGGTTTDGDEVNSQSQPLWQAAGTVLWPGGVVTVCFDAGFSQAQRDAIRAKVENEWEKAANIDMGNWDSCPTLNSSTTNLVAITIDPTSLNALGYSGQSVHCGDQTPASCNGATGKAPNGNFNRVRLLNATSDPHTLVHEFGHVLGFEHENRDDICAQRDAQHAGGAISLEGEGDFNNSIMVGCNGNATTLSNWDVLGARRAYGAKPTGSIVGLGGGCINVSNANTALGASVIGYACKGANNDKFSRVDLNFKWNQIATPADERCLNVSGGVVSPNGPTPLISWSCVPNATNEQFHFIGAEWRAMGKMCIQADSTMSGAKLSLQNCNGSSLQKWDFFEDEAVGLSERIRLNGTNRCVEAPSGAALGTELVMGVCNSSVAQNEQWTLSGGTMTSVVPGLGGLCANVSGGLTTPGNRVILWDGCTAVPAGPNNHFTIQGPITSLGQCVDMLGGVMFDGVGIGVYPCFPTPNQQWEYFF